jgi:hypothetical protein
MSFAFFLAAFTAWTGLTSENHLGGRKVSEGYLQGKVVLVQRWRGTDASSSRALERMERVWQSYKTKPFVLLGSHVPGAGTVSALEDVLAEGAITYPLYAGADLKELAPLSDKIPFYYVVDATGRVTFRGSNERLAEMALVNALTNLASPPRAAYWQRLIDSERDVLPGRAYLHLLEFRKRFPEEAAAYDGLFRALKADSTVEKLAKLEEFSRQAKDFDPRARAFEAKQMQMKIARTIKAYEVLKEEADPFKRQEAKNCLADLAWAAAALKARLDK